MAAISLQAISPDNTLSLAEKQGMVAITGATTGTRAGDVVTLTVHHSRYQGTVDAKGRFVMDVQGSDLAADADKKIEATVVASTAEGLTSTASTQSSVYGRSGVSLNAVSGDNMTHLGEAVTLSGTAAAGSTVTLTLGGGHTRQVTADAAGQWSLAATTAPATTRYVWLYQQTPNDPYNAWSVGEVVVMSGGVNVAAGKPATLSWSSGITTALTDGKPGSCAEAQGSGLWMQIDLGRPVAIDSIQVSPRADWPWRLIGTQVVLSNTDATTQTPSAMLTLAESSLLPRITQGVTTTLQVLPLGSGAQSIGVTGTNAQGQTEVDQQGVVVSPKNTLLIALDPISGDQQLNAQEIGSVVKLTGSTANAKAGDTVTLSVNQTTYQGTVDASGRFAIEVRGTDLAADADKRVEATVRSSAASGQAVTASSTSAVYTVDTERPAPTLSLEAMSPSKLVDTPEAAGWMAVTGSSTGARAGDRVSVHVHQQVYHGTVDAQGRFSVKVKISDVLADADRKLSVTLVASDSAGNTTVTSAPLAIPARAPSISLEAISDDNHLSRTEQAGMVAVSGKTTDARAGDAVSLLVNGVAYKGVVDAAGRFSIQVSGADLGADADKRVEATLLTRDAQGQALLVNASSAPYSLEPSPVNNGLRYGESFTLQGEARANSTVTLNFSNGISRQVSADAQGHWNATLTAAPEKARYVWLYQATPEPTYNTWSLSEVSVMSGGVNVAAGKLATLSWRNGSSTALTDGQDYTPVQAVGKGQWVQIDLGTAVAVDAIRIGGMLYWTEQLEGTTVVLSNTDASKLTPQEVLGLADAYVSPPLRDAASQTLQIVPLPGGTLNVSVSSTLASGIPSQVNHVLTVDATGLPKPALSLTEDTGVNGSDGITANGRLQVGFEGGGSAVWSYSLDNGKTWQAGSGNGFVLPPGSYAAQQVWVKTAEAAGHGPITKLSTALQVQSKALHSWIESDLYAQIPEGGTVSDAGPTLRGLLGAALAPDERVAVYLNGKYQGQATMTGKEWAYEFDALNVQSHQVTWRLEAAGPNGWSVRSEWRSHGLDVVEAGTPMRFNRAEVEQGLTFTGSGEPFTKIRVTLGDKVNTVVTADANGRWSSVFYKQESLYGPGIPANEKPLVKIEQMDATGTTVIKPLYEQQVHIDQTAPVLTSWDVRSADGAATLAPGERVTLTLNFSEDPGQSFTLNSLRSFGGTLSALSGSGNQRSVTFTADAVPMATEAFVELLRGELKDPAGNPSPSAQRWAWDLPVGTHAALHPSSQHFEVRAGKTVSLDLRDPTVNLDSSEWQVRISGVPAESRLSHGVLQNGSWTVSGRDLDELHLVTNDGQKGALALTVVYERKNAQGQWTASSQARIHGEIDAWLGIEDVREVEDFSNFSQLEQAWNLGLTSLSGKGIKVGINEGTSLNINDLQAFESGRVVAGTGYGSNSGEHGHQTGLRLAGSVAGGFTGAAYDANIKWINGNASGLDVTNWSVAVNGGVRNVWNVAECVTGRSGLGTVWVISAGNDRGWDNTSIGIDTKNPMAIVAASLANDSGSPADFSTCGPAVWVAHAGWGGTSFASPAIASQTALILEANSGLGVRDVKNILANAATYLPTATPTQGFGLNGGDTFNGGGFHHSNEVGFGSSNVYNAVRLAKDWLRQGEASTLQRGWETQSAVAQTTATSISASARTATTVSITVMDDVRLEALQLRQFLNSSNFDKMRVWITSPAGTTSELTQDNAWITQVNETFDLTSHQFFGESSKGTWTVRYEHKQDVAAPSTLSSVSLKFFGDVAPTVDRYVYTDQFNTHFAAADAATQKKMLWLTDGDGGTDAVMGSAMNTKIEVDLGRGGSVKLLDRSIGILGGAVIENAFGGDGDDLLIGNQVRGSVLGGNAGDDTLISRGHGSRLEGGEGLDTIWLQRGDVALGGEGADRFFFYERQLSFANVGELKRSVSDFDAAQDSVFKVDAQGALQVARFGAAGELLRWDAVADTSVLAEFAAMRTAAKGPVLMDMTVSGSTVGLVFDQALASESLDAQGFSLGSQQAQSVSSTDNVLNLGFGQVIGSGVVHLNFATDPVHSGLGLGFEANQVWLGTSGHEVIDASALADGNVLFSHGGHDTLLGGAGADTLWVQGADGGNSLRGGAGADAFAWNAPTGTAQAFAQGQDVVLDFKLGEDRLMLTDLFADVVETQSIDQWLQLSREGHSAVLRVDDDGDGQFDAGFSIKLQDFYLQNTTLSTLTLDELRRQGGLEG